MRRIVRTVIAILTTASVIAGLLVASVAVQAQSPTRVYTVGVLTVGDAAALLKQSLSELGYVEGRNVAYQHRNSEGKPERTDALAQELARRKVDVIVATNPAAVLAAKRATGTIPIIMVNTPDPVQLGIVRSLSSPGGNITGTTSLTLDLTVKQLELLKETVPRASRIAVLWNLDNPWHPLAIEELRKASAAPGVKLQILAVRDPHQLEDAFQAMMREHADAMMVLADPMLNSPAGRLRIAELAMKHRLPSMGGLRSYTEAGGMMSYWADETELYKRVASYVDRILKGADPGRLPIEQPTKYELVVNMPVAKALGQTIPPSLLLRARVME